MKLRTVCTTFAIALAACAASPSFANADEMVPVQQQQLSIHDQIVQLQGDVVEGTFSCVELSERIDNLVKRIDTLLDGEPNNQAELIQQRKLVLDLRLQIKCDHSGEENGSMLAGSSCNCGGGSAPAGGGGGGFVGKSASYGGGGGGGGGGAGGIIGLTAIGAAIAIPIAVSNDGSGGRTTSPSSN
jgi:TolA-binding protein